MGTNIRASTALYAPVYLPLRNHRRYTPFLIGSSTKWKCPDLHSFKSTYRKLVPFMPCHWPLNILDKLRLFLNRHFLILCIGPRGWHFHLDKGFYRSIYGLLVHLYNVLPFFTIHLFN